MLQIIQTEQVSFELPQKYLADVLSILQSGILDIRNDKCVLHFDSTGLKVIESTHKFITR